MRKIQNLDFFPVAELRMRGFGFSNGMVSKGMGRKQSRVFSTLI